MMRVMRVMSELDVMMMMSPGVSDTGGVRDAPRLISSQICERRLCFKLDKVASCPGLGIHFVSRHLVITAPGADITIVLLPLMIIFQIKLLLILLQY